MSDPKKSLGTTPPVSKIPGHPHPPPPCICQGKAKYSTEQFISSSSLFTCSKKTFKVVESFSPGGRLLRMYVSSLEKSRENALRFYWMVECSSPVRFSSRLHTLRFLPREVKNIYHVSYFSRCLAKLKSHTIFTAHVRKQLSK